MIRYDDEMKREEILDKLNLFKKTKTYTFLKIKYSSGFRMYNGYVLQVEESYIMIQDKVIGKLPVEIKDIIRVDVSKEHNGGSHGR